MSYQRQSSENGYDTVPTHDGDDQMQREVFRKQTNGQLFSSSRSVDSVTSVSSFSSFNNNVNGAVGNSNEYGYSTEYSNYTYPNAANNGDGNHSPRSSTYSADRGSGSGGMGGTVAAVGSGSMFTRCSLLDRNIEAIPIDAAKDEGKSHKYKGRNRVCLRIYWLYEAVQ